MYANRLFARSKAQKVGRKLRSAARRPLSWPKNAKVRPMRSWFVRKGWEGSAPALSVPRQMGRGTHSGMMMRGQGGGRGVQVGLSGLSDLEEGPKSMKTIRKLNLRSSGGH